KSEPPPSVDNSLPVLAATPSPITSRRPRRIVGLSMVAVAAIGLVVHLVRAPLGRHSERPAATGAPVTLGIGVPNPPSVATSSLLRPEMNSASQHAPTELVASPSAASATASESTAAPGGSSAVGLEPRVPAPSVAAPGSALLRPPSPA